MGTRSVGARCDGHRPDSDPDNRDDRYFTDAYQAMPLHGYTRLFERMLAHPNIKILLNTDYREVINLIPHREMVYTGPITNSLTIATGNCPTVRSSSNFKRTIVIKSRLLPS